MASKAVRRLAGNGSGQSFVDLVTSMKHSLSGSLIAKSICKATTEEMTPPKRKHLNILYNCTYESRLSMPEFANYIIGRSHNHSWVVSFKALITIHHLMNCGSERFSQYLASNNCQLSAPRSFEKNNSQANTMFAFIRHYARYVDARASSYCEVAFDFCRIKRKTDDVNMRTMSQPKLNKILGPLERQIDALLAFDASSSELLNSVILAAYYLLYKDLIRLYAVYNEAMINIIEHFFTMSKKDCQESLRTYKSFVKRMEHVNSFVKVAEACESLQVQDGFGKQSLIFKPVPTSVLEALEQHLAHLEGRKASERSPWRTSPSDLAVAQLFPSNLAFSTQPSIDASGMVMNLSNEQKQRIVEEERQRLEQFITQARVDNLHTPLSPIGRSNSDGDLLELFGTASSNSPFGTVIEGPTAAGGQQHQTRQTANSTTPTIFTGFDELFCLPSQQPAISASSNPYALQSTTNKFALSASNAPSNSPLRPLSQFLSNPTPPSFTPAVLPSTNPFANAICNSPQPPTTQNDLDNRLAEIAGYLTIANTNNSPTVTSVNWAAASGTRPAGQMTSVSSNPVNHLQMQPTAQPIMMMMQASNPWPNASLSATGSQPSAYNTYSLQPFQPHATAFPTLFTNSSPKQMPTATNGGNSTNPFL